MAFRIPGKIIYLAHPRTGSNAVQSALGTIYPRGVVRVGHHAKYAEIVSQEPYRDELVATTVRNHYLVLARWWHYRTRGASRPWMGATTMTQFIERFVEGEWVENGRLFLHLEDADLVMYYEELAGHFEDLLEEAGLPSVPIPVVNPTPDVLPISDYYDEESADLVQRIFGEEMAELGYTRPW